MKRFLYFILSFSVFSYAKDIHNISWYDFYMKLDDKEYLQIEEYILQEYGKISPVYIAFRMAWESKGFIRNKCTNLESEPNFYRKKLEKECEDLKHLTLGETLKEMEKDL